MNNKKNPLYLFSIFLQITIVFLETLMIFFEATLMNVNDPFFVPCLTDNEEQLITHAFTFSAAASSGITT